MTLASLEHEYRTVLIGDEIYARVRLLAERLLRRRDPKVYARGAHDYRDALGDVVNDFVLAVLIEERQIDYVMATVTDLDSFDRLIGRQLRRYLARTRTRTVIDNLLDRAISLLREPPFVSEGSGSTETFSLGDSSNPSDGYATESDLRRAAALAQAVPKIASRGEERAPKVYDRAGLARVLVILCRQVATALTRQDLQTFFGYLLTAWTPSFLEQGEDFEEPASDLLPSDEAVISETAMQLATDMNDEERLIFRYKAANLPDRDLATALGLSRQSTAPRKQALFTRLMTELSDVEEELRARVLGHLSILLATEEGQIDDPQ